MFTGHYGAGYAGKAAAPRLPLWSLFLATQGIDILWALLILCGVERARIAPGITATSPLDLYYMPYTHGLFAALGWALLTGAGYRLAAGRNAGRPAFVLGAVVFSHWLLDLVAHRPDLPLIADRWKVGLGLWNLRGPSFALEIGFMASGVWLYLRAMPQMRRSRKAAAVALALLIPLIQAAGLYGGRPLGSIRVVALTNLTLYILFAAIAGWIERPRLSPASRGG